MQPSELISERFEIERLAGSGGMGRVYRARDRQTGEPVALKVLHGGGWEHAAERFSREAATLASLSHPRIVRYVDHGVTAGGDPYLAMEWLEGEELSTRIGRAPLTVDETVRLGILAAETLAAAHAKGVVHRDVKPSNLFLVAGDVERVKVLDFGLARLGGAASEISHSGAMLGTPAYMSPEQARLDKKLDSRTDLFSLGCVLFKCLTGQLPFVGENLVAVLAKVMLEPAARVDLLRPGIPARLADLVSRLLEKDPSHRPGGGIAVAEELAALGAIGEIAAARVEARPPSLTGLERKVVSIVLANKVVQAPTGQPGMDSMLETVVEQRSLLAALEEAVEPFGAHVTLLADGSAVVALPARGSASDPVARAARCALALRPVCEAPIALAIGRTDAGGAEGLGQVIDRAALLLRGGGRIAKAFAEDIRLDDSTAALLEGRFEVTEDRWGYRLGGERLAKGAGRTLLGKPTPFVGRTRELGTLQAVYEECVTEPVARAVLVTGPAGIGKSRLRHELLKSLEASDDPPQVWISRADPISAGSPLGMLSSLVRRAAAILDGEPLEVRREKLRARVAQNRCPDPTRVATFLGEMIGAPFPDQDDVQLRSARRDPALMGDQMRRAWEDLTLAECANGPLVVVLEDVHWGDLPTISFVDSALRHAADAPLLVLALARPEVRDTFPKLWNDRALVPMPLAELTPKASEKLARAVLEGVADTSTIARVVQRAGGNAFFLEEIVRHVAGGGSPGAADAELPESVLAVVGARLESLEPEARRVLRAASVFGQVFWRGGVLAMLGGGDDKTLAGEWLAELTSRELITRRAESKFEREREFTFHHAFVRDAAYAMLTDADLELGHRLAGRWLEANGEEDAMVLAEHFQRGHDLGEAIGWYLRGAAQALAANDYETVLARAAKAVQAGAGGETLGRVRLLEAEASRYRADHANVARFGEEAMRLLPPGTAEWCAAVGEVASSRHRLGDVVGLEALAPSLERLPAPFDAHHLLVAYRVATSLLFAGSYELSERLADRAETASSATVRSDPAVRARLELFHGSRALFGGAPVEYLRWMRAAAESFEQAGDARAACTPRANVGCAYIELGAYEEAEAELGAVVARAQRLGLRDVEAGARHNLGIALGHMGRVDEARKEQRAALEVYDSAVYRRMEAAARIALAEIELAAGDASTALSEATLAVELAEMVPPMKVYALGVQASAMLASGRVDEARGPAAEAARLLATLGRLETGESLVGAVEAEVTYASGDMAEARRLIVIARTKVLARAERIEEPALRKSFLERVPDNARVLARARAWGAQ